MEDVVGAAVGLTLVAFLFAGALYAVILVVVFILFVLGFLLLCALVVATAWGSVRLAHSHRPHLGLLPQALLPKLELGAYGASVSYDAPAAGGAADRALLIALPALATVLVAFGLAALAASALEVGITQELGIILSIVGLCAVVGFDHAAGRGGAPALGGAYPDEHNALSDAVGRVCALGEAIEELSELFAPPFDAPSELEARFRRHRSGPPHDLAGLVEQVTALEAEAEDVLVRLEGALGKWERVRHICAVAGGEVAKTADLRGLEEVHALSNILTSAELLGLLSDRAWAAFDQTLEDVAARLKELVGGRSGASGPGGRLEWALNVLGLRDAHVSYQEVKAQYRNLVKRCHPDRFHNASEEVRREASRRFREIREAFRILQQHHGVNV